jgi:hypothetical protein
LTPGVYHSQRERFASHTTKQQAALLSPPRNGAASSIMGSFLGKLRDITVEAFKGFKRASSSTSTAITKTYQQQQGEMVLADLEEGGAGVSFEAKTYKFTIIEMVGR